MNSTEHDASDFDLDLGKTWIYPSNLPVRKYQKEIVGEALFKNTMVCLPTGLGKTLIAAVVMYNFYRWYPSGKVIFMATTKPLVKQQVDACYRIVAMPKESTAELTGSVLKQNREKIWNDKRVFFVTPQVLRNDLDVITDLGTKIKCIVIDEAHRARGNHAYCEVISKLFQLNGQFRVLALTATPASNLFEVINVCKLLLISHLEVRTEDSLDVVPYLHKKIIQTMVIKLDGKLLEVIEAYKRVLDKYVRILVEHRVIQSNIGSLHKGRLFYLHKDYQEKNIHNQSSKNYKLITKVFATCMILYHAFDLLLRNGLRCFLNYFEDNINKPLLTSSSSEIQEIMESIKAYVGPALVCDKLPDGSHLKLPETCRFGHPKYYKLREVLADHFAANDAHSKVIIFCEYRVSVAEAYAALLHQPAVKPKMFMGQQSITQKQQVNIIDSFRDGAYNTLISTCIGEEGIDVGFVDLVVCFDIANKSSVRFIQRIGRTGRDRSGKVVILVTEGREQQMLKECLQEKEHLCAALAQAKNIDGKLYEHSPRMVPANVTPQCQEIDIAPRKAPSVKNCLIAHSPPLSSPTLLAAERRASDTLRSNITNLIPINKESFLTDDVREQAACFKFNLPRHVALQRNALCMDIPTSLNSQILIDSMKHVEYLRYNIFNSVPINYVATKKQADIRKMFKQYAQSSKSVPAQSVETLLDAKLTHMLANPQECTLCDQLENVFNVKRDLVPIGNLNLKLVFNFDSRDICRLQNKINERLDSSRHEKSMQRTEIGDTLPEVARIADINCNKAAGTAEDGPSNNIPQENKNSVVVSTHHDARLSPDLFDDDFPEFSPPTLSQYDNLNKEIETTIYDSNDMRLEEQREQQKLDEVVDDDDDNIIEGSPSPVVKRKSSQSSLVGMRSRKRLKLNITDIFNIPVNACKAVPEARKVVSGNSVETTSKEARLPNPQLESFESQRPQKVKLQNADNFNPVFAASVVLDANSDHTPVVPNVTVTNNQSSQAFKRGRPDKVEMQVSDIFDLDFTKAVSERNAASNETAPSKPFPSATTRRKKLLTFDDIFDKSFKLPTKSCTNSQMLPCTESQEHTVLKAQGDQFVALERDVTSLDDIYEAIYADDKNDSVAPIQTHAMYLQSIKSGRPEKARMQISDIFDFDFAKTVSGSNVSTMPPKSPSTASSPDLMSYHTTSNARMGRKKLMTFDDIVDKSLQLPTKSDVNSETPTCTVFQESTVLKSPSIEAPIQTNKRTGSKRARQFVDWEADVTSDEAHSADEHISGQDDIYEASFVDDESDCVAPSTQTQAMYLRSTRTPATRAKPLRRPAARHADDTQINDTVDLTYMRDSFCVADSDSGSCCADETMDELERAELELKRRRRKNGEVMMNVKQVKQKRKRICRIESDSD